jgi:molecular chaperone GrpE (heat shock protein)
MMDRQQKEALLQGVSQLVETIDNCTDALNQAVETLLDSEGLTSQEINSLVGLQHVRPDLQNKLQNFIVLH